MPIFTSPIYFQLSLHCNAELKIGFSAWYRVQQRFKFTYITNTLTYTACKRTKNSPENYDLTCARCFYGSIQTTNTFCLRKYTYHGHIRQKYDTQFLADETLSKNEDFAIATEDGGLIPKERICMRPLCVEIDIYPMLTKYAQNLTLKV